jgi:hypothetical protein
MYPCIRPFCVAMSPNPLRPCIIHSRHPHYVPEQEPVVKIEHWETETLSLETSDPDFAPADPRL